jgi:hypothetical protein
MVRARNLCPTITRPGDRQAVVVAMDPTTSMGAAGNPKLVELAEAVKQKLSRALAKLE